MERKFEKRLEQLKAQLHRELGGKIPLEPEENRSGDCLVPIVDPLSLGKGIEWLLKKETHLSRSS